MTSERRNSKACNEEYAEGYAEVTEDEHYMFYGSVRLKTSLSGQCLNGDV
jgi:hypothetical protein